MSVEGDLALIALSLVLSLLVAVGLSKYFWNSVAGASPKLIEPEGCKPASATLPLGSQYDYRSRGYGRYKYCGLREDPFATTEPPQPCQTPYKILLPPDLTNDQTQKLSMLVERVADLKNAGFRTDPATLLRYLRARNYDLAGAERHVREAVAWRQKHNLQTVFTQWNLEAYHECLGPWYLSGGILGHGKKGQPIAYERLGRVNFAKLAASMPFDLLLKCDMVHCEHCVAAIEEDAIRRGVPMRGVILVTDLQGFGWDQVQYNAIRKLSKLVESRNLLLTEMTAKILAVNAPPAAARAWSICSYLLDRGTVEKVEVVIAKDTFQALRVHVDDAEIPAFLGGQKEIHGDPECRAVLAPGGLPPPSVLARFEKLARMEKGTGHT